MIHQCWRRRNGAWTKLQATIDHHAEQGRRKKKCFKVILHWRWRYLCVIISQFFSLLLLTAIIDRGDTFDIFNNLRQSYNGRWSVSRPRYFLNTDKEIVTFIAYTVILFRRGQWTAKFNILGNNTLGIEECYFGFSLSH